MKAILAAGACALALLSTAAWGRAAGPTDPQIAAIVVAANHADINAGRLAESKGHSKQVRAFGRRMVADHTSVNKLAEALVRKLHVTPEVNSTSESLERGGKENLERLRKLHGMAFDRAYIDHEVTYHEQVIDALDNTLIPSAQNPQLKALLVKVRPAFEAHLKMAKQIQAELDGKRE